MKKLSLIAIYAFASFICHGQSLSPNVISPAGGLDKTDAIQVEWTLGESSIETISQADKIYTEGFHQPSLRVIGIEAGNNSSAELYHVTVAPNPVSSVLTVTIQTKETQRIYFTLTDISGQRLSTSSVTSASSEDVDMSNLASAIYMLHVYNDNGSLIKTYKISKIQ